VRCPVKRKRTQTKIREEQPIDEPHDEPRSTLKRKSPETEVHLTLHEETTAPALGTGLMRPSTSGTVPLGPLNVRSPETLPIAPTSVPTEAIRRVAIEDFPEASDATQVGVQLVLREGKVGDVLVAGRPASPFTGTMGDHVTAFGVHVVNLRRVMQGKDLKTARKDLVALCQALKKLPGWAFIEAGDSDWHRRLAALEQTVNENPGDSADAQVAALQRIAALYLEVREGIPLSLLNTRSLTADTGRGRGEAKWLSKLAEGGVPQKQTKRRKLTSAATPDQIDTARGLFDDDASAMLTLNQEMGQEANVAGLLPAHTNIAALIKTSTADLIEILARQHAMRLFPTAEEDELKAVAETVAETLREAHTARAKADGAEWRRRVGVTLDRINMVRNSMDKGANWLRQGSSTPDGLESALRDIGLLTAGAGTELRSKLTTLYETVPDTVGSVWDVARIPYQPDRTPLEGSLRQFLKVFTESLQKISNTRNSKHG